MNSSPLEKGEIVFEFSKIPMVTVEQIDLRYSAKGLSIPTAMAFSNGGLIVQDGPVTKFPKRYQRR